MTHTTIELLLIIIIMIVVGVLTSKIARLQKLVAFEQDEVKRQWEACDEFEELLFETRKQNQTLMAVLSQIERLALLALPDDEHICPAYLLEIIHGETDT